MRRFDWAVGLAVAGTLAGCASAGDSGDGNCPAGEQWNGTECVRATDTGRPPRDAGGGGDTSTPDTGDTSTPDSSVEPQNCEPNEAFCADLQTAALCNAAGTAATLTPCADGVVCVDGTCSGGEVNECTPGEVLRCSSPTAQLVCNSAGDGTEDRPCPVESPNCEGGACTDRICTAGRRSCDGNNVVLCSDDGRTQTFVETCDTGCSGGECIDPCAGDGKSYVGCGFFAADLDNFQVPCTSSVDCGLGGACDAGYCTDSNAAAQQFAVTVSNDSTSGVEVTIFNGTGDEVARQNIAAGELRTFPLPRNDVDDSVLNTNSYRIESTGPITAHQFNPADNVGVFSNDASLLLPITSLGTEYIVLGWPTVGDTSISLKGFVTIVGTSEAPTTVTVTSPVATLAGRSGTPAALTPGVPTEFTLTKGQVLQFSNSTNGQDLTGMIINASAPVAVFAGSECANVPLDNQYCDHIEEQLFPVNTWDRDFVLARFKPRGREPDVIRVLAAQDGTTIRINPNVAGMDGRVLNRGQFVEFQITQNHILGATGPVSVAQYMVGSSFPGQVNGCDRDPFFGNPARCAIPSDARCDNGTAVGDPASVMLVPVSQFRRDYLLLTPADYVDDFITVVSPIGATVTLDGSPLTGTRTSVGTWDVTQALVADGVHRIESTVPVGVIAYGYDCDVSYAYPGGLNLESVR